MGGDRSLFSERTIEGGEAVIDGAEARHALQVLRMRPGDKAVLFDGSGREFVARLSLAGKREAVFEILESREGAREPALGVTVASAVPKGKRADFLVEKLCELGAAEFMPLWTARSTVDPRVRPENHVAKWRRAVVEASKQCGRRRLMRIAEPVDLAAALRNASAFAAGWVCAPDGADEGLGVAALSGPRLVVVGPEGGLDAGEMEAALAAGLKPLSLGPTILRIETAAVVALGRVLFESSR